MMFLFFLGFQPGCSYKRCSYKKKKVYLVGAFELLSTVLSTDDGVTDFWFLNFRLFTSEKRKKTPLQLDSIEVSTAVIYGLILQQVFPYAEENDVVCQICG